MDIKTGNGAFASDYKMAQELAQSIANVSSNSGVPTSCLITDMDQVLGHSVGNAIEVVECIDFLKNPNNADHRLLELTIELSAYMLQLSGLASDLQTARIKSMNALESGKAASIFGKMITELGGPSDLMERPEKHLKPMPVITPIRSNSSGYISEIDARAIGLSMIHLKAGRTKSSDAIDHGVGLSNIVSKGQWVSKGDPIATAHCRDQKQLDFLQLEFPSLIKLDEKEPQLPNLIKEVLSSNQDLNS
jgi:thymidine phosphorylase